jgi:hypothetical protein
MTVNRRLLGLAVGHLVLGIIGRLLVSIELPRFFDLVYIVFVPLYYGLAFCQALLLSLWGAASSVSPPVRVAGLIAGVVYVEALFLSVEPVAPELSAITVMIATAALLVVRVLGVRLIRFDGRSQPTPSGTEGFRFSIRALLLVTAAVALLSAGARALQQAPGVSALRTVCWAMCVVAVGLVALWAALGLGRPLWRGPVVFALSLVVGAFLASATEPQGAVVGWVISVLIMLLYSTLLLGSLLIVRSCGYRFVRRVASSSKLPDEQTGSHPLGVPASGVTTPE